VTATTGEVLEVERHIAARPETVFGYFTGPARYASGKVSMRSSTRVPVVSSA
jgi:hypothetical protein